MDRGSPEPNQDLFLSAGPNMPAMTGAPRIDPPSIKDDASEDEMSDEASQKPLGIEELKQRVESTKKNDAKKRKGKGIGNKKWHWYKWLINSIIIIIYHSNFSASSCCSPVGLGFSPFSSLKSISS